MNPPASSLPPPVLNLSRRVSYVAHGVSPEPVAEGALADEFEALREREANLRAYEARLRVWQDQLDAAGRATAPTASVSPFSGSRAPFPSPIDGELQDSWEKFHRARALLQAEQNQLRDERMAWQEREASLMRREAGLAAREANVAAREQLLEQALAAAGDDKRSGVRRFAQAPLLAARAVFGPNR